MFGDYRTKFFCTLCILTLLFGGGCGEDERAVGDDDNDGSGGKEDAWDGQNNPYRFGSDFIYSHEELLAYNTGESDIVPWPDTYWPMNDDGYNARWRGQSIMSPVELYDLAFNDWQPPEGFMDLRPFSRPGSAYDADYYLQIGPAASWAHDKGGNRRAREIHNPDGTLIESVDADRDGIADEDFNGDGDIDRYDAWGGLEGWFGHCHAWAPASYSHPEPQHSVTVNDVTFEVADIKALIESTHEGCGGTLFLGGRCNLREMTRDEFGRVVENECRDTNAGAFHVVITNVVGRLGRSFVADITTDYQVWNHPVRDYRITTNEIVNEERACELVGRSDASKYPYNDDAVSFAHVEMTFRYVVEGNASTEPFTNVDRYTRTRYYEYLLELDENGDIIGGEWISRNQPDFLWATTTNCDARNGWYSPPVVRAADVETLIELSTSSEPPPVTGDEHHFDSTNAEPIEIPDNDSNGITSVITVDESLIAAGIRVSVNIPHTYIGDLIVELVRNGQTVSLQNRTGGSQDNLVAAFDVSEFNGQDAAGEWSLRVSDNARIDTGELDNWRLTVITQ